MWPRKAGLYTSPNEVILESAINTLILSVRGPPPLLAHCALPEESNIEKNKSVYPTLEKDESPILIIFENSPDINMLFLRSRSIAVGRAPKIDFTH